MEKEIITIPLLPLRGITVYPTMVLHLDVGRDRSMKAIDKVMLDEHKILLATQKEVSLKEPKEDEIYPFGVIAHIKQILKLPNGTMRILIEAEKRAEIVEFISKDHSLK